MVKYYNVANCCRLKVVYKCSILKRLLDSLSIQLRVFEVPAFELPPDVELIIVDRLDEGLCERAEIFDGKTEVGDSTLTSRAARKLGKWAYNIQVNDGRLRCYLSTNLFSSISKPHFFAEFLIQVSLLSKGVSVVHASGAILRGKAYLFAGTSGAGKTTLSMSIMREGVFLGDNYVIVKDGVAHAYRTPLNLFSYNLTPFVLDRLSYIDRFSLFVRMVIYRFTFGYFKIFLKFPMDRISDPPSQPLPIAALITILPSSGYSNDKLEKCDGLGIDRVIENMRIEWAPMYGDILLYSIHNDDILARYFDRLDTVMRSNLSNVKRYKIRVPTAYNDSNRNRVVEAIRTGLEGSAEGASCL